LEPVRAAHPSLAIAAAAAAAAAKQHYLPSLSTEFGKLSLDI